MAGIKKSQNRSATLDDVLTKFAGAPEMSAETRDGKPKRVGNKPATARQIFASVIRQVENATAPESANPDPKWQATCEKLRDILGLQGGQGRAADSTPAPSGDLDSLL